LLALQLCCDVAAKKGEAMGSITLFGLKNCDTCKKAMKVLAAGGRDIEFVDIRSGANLADKVPVWLSLAGAEALINKRSTTWRGLGDDERSQADDERAADLLVSTPTLIKRPVIEDGDHVFVGWSKDVQDKLI
jgi:arsenate reductase